jgi:hypothetical protein
MSSVWAILLFFPVVGLIACVWAFFDVLVRPAVMLRVAGVSRRKRAFWFAILAVAICLCAAVVGLGHPNHFLSIGCGLGIEVFGAVGLAVASWYLLIVRRWIAAQLHLAQAGLPRA